MSFGAGVGGSGAGAAAAAAQAAASQAAGNSGNRGNVPQVNPTRQPRPLFHFLPRLPNFSELFGL